MVEIRVSQDGDANNFGWAAGTFQREGYNPSDAGAMDTLMQAGWCEVGDLKYDDERGGMTPADLYKDDVLVFRNSRGTIEKAARYEGENAFSYADMNGIVHRESRAEFATSHADALKCGATIMRETNTHRHRMLAESVRPLVTELRGMDSSSRRMSSWPPKLSRAVADCVFNQFGLYANAHLDKTNPPRDNILFPKEKFMEQFQDDVKKLHAEDRLTPQEVEKYADEIYAASKVQRRLAWVRARVQDLRTEYGSKKILTENGEQRKPSPDEVSAMVNSDDRYLGYLRRAEVANCQETSAVLSACLRKIADGTVNVEVVGQKEQNGVDHVYVAIGRAPRTDIRNPQTWNRDVIVVDGWKGWIGSIGDMFPPPPSPSADLTLSSDAAGLIA